MFQNPIMDLQPRFHKTADFQDFWFKGNGKELVEMTGAQLSLNDFQHFAPLYSKVDETGDAAANSIFKGKSFDEVSQLIAAVAQQGINSFNDVPEGVKKLFAQLEETPDWVDFDLINKGAALCMRSGVNALIVLRDFTLMGGYDFAYLNKPLIFTGSLKKGAVKRLTYTLEFWINVTRKDGLKLHAKGYELCARTRLIHAYSRKMILDKVTHWDKDKWGQPINQWDMIATYMGFSLMFLLGLKKLSLKIQPEEEKGLFHLWKYVGYLIGIPPEYMPDNSKSATEQFYLWTTIQPSADADSVMLAHSLLDESLESMIYKQMSMRKRLRYLHICCNWFLLDKQLIERLQIPKVKNKEMFPRFLLARNQIFQFLPYRQQIKLGDKAQQKVLRDYLRQ